MPNRLTPEQVSDYQQNGVLSPIPVLSADEVRRFRAGYDELLAAFDRKPKSIELGVTHLHFRWAWDLVTHPKVLDAAEDVLGPDLLVWSSSIFAKPARDPEPPHLSPRRNLLGPGLNAGDHSLDRALPQHSRKRLHEGRPRHPERSDSSAQGDLGGRQSALARPRGSGGCRRRGRCGHRATCR